MGRSKSYEPLPETITEHFCCGNTHALLIELEKLIKISVLISVLVSPLQRWEVWDKFQNLNEVLIFINDPHLYYIHLRVEVTI